MAGERARRAFWPCLQPRITWFRVALRDVLVLNARKGGGCVGARRRVDVLRRMEGRPRKRARNGDGMLAVVSLSYFKAMSCSKDFEMSNVGSLAD